MYKMISILLMLFILMSCSDGNDMVEESKVSTIKDVSEFMWNKLSTKKIYFGHQSVGENILDGFRDVMKEQDAIDLTIKESDNSNQLENVNIMHSSIGKNGDPVGKIVDFKRNLDAGLGNKVDVAVAKLCFWDIRSTTDIEEVFNKYSSTLEEMKVLYPDTIFMHMTVPLMSHSTGFLDNLKRMIRDDNDDLANIKRNELNQMILNKYEGREPIFDIARFESTLSDGRRTFFIKDGKKYYYLPDVYTQDGGHLNEKGRKFVAEQMLIKLADIIR